MLYENTKHDLRNVPRRRVLQAAGAGGLSGIIPSTASAQQEALEVGDEITTDTHGPASLTVQSAVSHLVGSPTDGTSYMVTRDQEPARLGQVDMATREVTGVFEIPSGSISYGVTSLNDGRDIYVGMYPGAELYHFDPESEEFTLKASLGGLHVMDLQTLDPGIEADNGPQKVFIGTCCRGRVLEYDHQTGAIQDYGPAKPGKAHAMSVEPTPETIYVGTSTAPADFVAIDRETGTRESLLPPEVREANPNFVLDIDISKDMIAIVTGSPSYLVILDRRDPSQYHIVPMTDDPIEPNLMAVAIKNEPPFNGQDNAIYFIGHSGKLYRYDESPDTVVHVETPAPGDASHYELYLRDNIIYGSGISGSVWTYDLATQSIQATNIQDAGLPPSPEKPKGITAHGSEVYVGGAWQTTLFDLEADSRTRRRSWGEQQGGMIRIGDSLYEGIYPRALIVKHDLSDDSQEVAELVGRIGHDQYRPKDHHYDEYTGYLFIASIAGYGKSGGALTTFDPVTDEIVSVDRNIVEGHGILTVTSLGDTAFIGTNGSILAAWDIHNRGKRWEMQPVDSSIRFLTMAATADGAPRIVGISGGGRLFMVDPATQEVVHSQDVGGAGKLIVPEWDDRVYGVDVNHIYRFDLETNKTETLVDGLGIEWWGVPGLAADSERNLYTAKGRDLLEVHVPRDADE